MKTLNVVVVPSPIEVVIVAFSDYFTASVRLTDQQDAASKTRPVFPSLDRIRRPMVLTSSSLGWVKKGVGPSYQGSYNPPLPPSYIREEKVPKCQHELLQSPPSLTFRATVGREEIHVVLLVSG
ncbi:hypothetical protein DNTS_028661 [Danionella cerebrum]|uniref:Uncharacterized protein n=1 Tax=Danionella cerebrum TaxID=2873325 RepID=A0A553QQS6_9TELE|nr:hypothetical protein DNTS_028661 [Danionella translucida]